MTSLLTALKPPSVGADGRGSGISAGVGRPPELREEPAAAEPPLTMGALVLTSPLQSAKPRRLVWAVKRMPHHFVPPWSMRKSTYTESPFARVRTVALERLISVKTVSVSEVTVAVVAAVGSCWAGLCAVAETASQATPVRKILAENRVSWQSKVQISIGRTTLGPRYGPAPGDVNRAIGGG